MSRWTSGTWKTGGRQRSRRFIQRARRKGISMSFWQRTTAQPYHANEAIRRAGGIFAEDAYNALLETIEWAKGDTARMVNIVMDEAKALAYELRVQTPLDPKGPNDPPLHAREAWRFKVDSRGGSKALISISNPKHYMSFLEERGGRSDHPGANVGGWMSDAFNHFALRLRGRLI